MTMFGPESPSFAECFGFQPGDDDITQLRKFWQAVTPARLPHAYIPAELLSPKPPKEKLRFSSLSPCIYLAAAMASAEVVLTLLKKRPPILAPNVLQIDLLTRAMAVTPVDTPFALYRGYAR